MYKNGCQTNYESGCDKSFSENENIFPVNKNTRADSIKTKSVSKKQISVEKGKNKNSSPDWNKSYNTTDKFLLLR